MKPLCTTYSGTTRLTTWIPVLILIQCGLIILYISIIQDKARTPASSIRSSSSFHLSPKTSQIQIASIYRQNVSEEPGYSWNTEDDASLEAGRRNHLNNGVSSYKLHSKNDSKLSKNQINDNFMKKYIFKTYNLSSISIQSETSSVKDENRISNKTGLDRKHLNINDSLNSVLDKHIIKINGNNNITGQRTKNDKWAIIKDTRYDAPSSEKTDDAKKREVNSMNNREAATREFSQTASIRAKWTVIIYPANTKSSRSEHNNTRDQFVISNNDLKNRDNRYNTSAISSTDRNKSNTLHSFLMNGYILNQTKSVISDAIGSINNNVQNKENDSSVKSIQSLSSSPLLSSTFASLAVSNKSYSVAAQQNIDKLQITHLVPNSSLMKSEDLKYHHQDNHQNKDVKTVRDNKNIGLNKTLTSKNTSSIAHNSLVAQTPAQMAKHKYIAQNRYHDNNSSSNKNSGTTNLASNSSSLISKNTTSREKFKIVRVIERENVEQLSLNMSKHQDPVVVKNLTTGNVTGAQNRTDDTKTYAAMYNKLFFNKSSSNQPNMFKSYVPTSPPVFHIHPDKTRYFSRHARNLTCLDDGTSNVFVQGEQEACICKPNWNGAHCSVHDSAMYTSALRYMNTLRLLHGDKVRRVINAMTFNVEWELLEARLYELDNLVDVYLIAESNYTQFGDPKPLYLLERLKQGYLQQFHHKIAYVYVDIFPAGGKDNGWLVDQFARTHISEKGLKQLTGLRDDDIIIYTDADEIPSREVIQFLKIHSGYPEPFGLALRWSVFGFFWKQYDLTRIMAGCSLRMLRYLFNNDMYRLRTTNYYQQSADNVQAVQEFSRQGGIILEWYFGDGGGSQAGWHCSWCMTPDRIRVKLMSAINADFPRWGDFPEKREITYIKKLIKTGTWFDDKTTFNSLVNKDMDSDIAPKFTLDHYEIYKHLLDIHFVT